MLKLLKRKGSANLYYLGGNPCSIFLDRVPIFSILLEIATKSTLSGKFIKIEFQIKCLPPLNRQKNSKTQKLNIFSDRVIATHALIRIFLMH